MQHPNRVYSRGQLLDYVWGEDVYIEERTVDVHVLRLRKLLKQHDVADMLQTVRGAGYKFTVKIND
jgi:two-component system phosphate regulon response regulator PhoB